MTRSAKACKLNRLLTLCPDHNRSKEFAETMAAIGAGKVERPPAVERALAIDNLDINVLSLLPGIAASVRTGAGLAPVAKIGLKHRVLRYHGVNLSAAKPRARKEVR